MADGVMLIKNVTNVETAVSVLQEIVALPVKEWYIVNEELF